MTDLGDFVGPAFDTNHGYTRDTGIAIRDGARANAQIGSVYLEAERYVKFCLACPHWLRMHPKHGPCFGRTRDRWRGPSIPCPCPEFVDPEPGRPDRVLTRAQVDRMLRYRFEAIKDKLYLLRDGNYGIWDEWSSEEWKARPARATIGVTPAEMRDV